MKLKPKHLAGVAIVVFILIIMNFIPEILGLSFAGIKTICMLVAFLVMLITEPLQLTHTCFIFLGLMPVFGVAPTFADALRGLANPVIIFVIASFCIASAFTELPISKRVLIVILRRYGKNVKLMLLAIMVCAAMISAFVSNVPTCAIFMAIALSFLELYDDPVEKKRAGRAFMIGVPIASMVGGIMTPIGSSINLLALSLLEEYTGTTITFVQWMAAGIPVAVTVLPVSWWLILKIHKPAEISGEMVKKFIKNLDIPEKISRPEINVLIITGIMMVLWILSSWIKSINIMVVSILGACAYCIPQIKTLKFETFLNGIGWDSIFLIGTVLSLGGLMVTNGVSDWIISILPVMNVSTPVLVAFATALLFILLTIIPVAPSLITIISLPLIALATSAGSSPALMTLVAAICGCCCFLLPLDTVTLLTYGTGYYSIKDMFNSSLPTQIFIIIVTSLWLTVIGRAFGMV